MKKISLCLIVFLIVNAPLNARHLVGGQLSYTCESENLYNIKLSLYRDCTCVENSGSCSSFDNIATITIFNGENEVYETLELNLDRKERLKPNISDLCIDEVPNVCVEGSIGYEATIKLPFSAKGYQLVYQRCCRNVSTNRNNTIETGTTYQLIIPPDDLASCNNSPVFSNYPPIAICIGYPFEFNHSAIDIDGDSLVYELCTPFSGATENDPRPETASTPPYEPIVWEEGFSASNPILSNPKVSLNANTGQFSGLPTAVGIYVVGVCVKEYRNGNLLSTSIRDFQFNVIDCTVAEFLSTCKRSNQITAQIFYDLNQNKIKETEEIWLNNLAVQIDPLGILGFPNYLNEGIFFVSPGAYTVSYNAENNKNWELTTDTLSHSFNLATDENKMLSFGAYPIETISDVQTLIVSPPTRCNESIAIHVIAKNNGTTVSDGILWFDNDRLSPPTFAEKPDTMVEPDTYGWFFRDLYPSQIIDQEVEILAPGPVLVELEDTSLFQLAEALEFSSRIEYTDINGEHRSDSFEYEEIRCSFDPNDKLVHPSRIYPHRVGNFTLFEEEITYTIRFQNTGNDEAYNILITDKIDNNLDLTSLKIINSSHLDKLTTKLNDGRELSFVFNDINLPDSTSNLADSQGYVSYSIKAKSGLAENTFINNSASIYFDLNPAVQTNTVQSRMVSQLPIVSVNDNALLPALTIWPNPTNGLFNIDGLVSGNYSIFNVFGEFIKEGTLQGETTLDLVLESKGVYFIVLEKNGKSAIERIVKM